MAFRRFGGKRNRVDYGQLLAVVTEFITAPTWLESRRILEAHPELLSQAADALLAQLAQAQDDERAAVVEDHRALLQRCRALGVDTAFTAMTAGREAGVPEPPGGDGDMADPGISRELQSLVEEADRLTRTEELPRRIQVYEQALALMSRYEVPSLWAALQVELANSIAQNPLGDRAGNLERAIGCYQAALQVFTREALPADWAMTQHSLGNAYGDRVRGDRAGNVEQVARRR
ncbi:MAG: hypothetical protein ACRDZO_00770 [Egibacteraceae bacterium]